MFIIVVLLVLCNESLTLLLLTKFAIIMLYILCCSLYLVQFIWNRASIYIKTLKVAPEIIKPFVR
jgi:hypothetical protein